MKKIVIMCGVIIAVFMYGIPAQAIVIHESATLGVTGQTTGFSLNPFQYLGSRFTLTQTYNVEAVGGHLALRPGSGNDKLFATIIDLKPSALPAADLTTLALASTIYTPPVLSTDFLTPLSVTLTPGDYALILGSGLFGATGYGVMPGFDTDIGIQSYFGFMNPPGGWFDGFFDDTRFVVQGALATPVPEPATVALLGIGLVGLAGAEVRRRRKKKAVD